MSAGNNSKKLTMKPVSVKALVEFAAKTGSIDRKFTPGPSAMEGIEGHKRVAANRSDDYDTEISLSIEYQNLLIRGRADGYRPDKNCIEEIKTFYGDFEKIPKNHQQLHWAQAKMYGWMFCTQEGYSEINLALVYFHLGDQKEYRLEEQFTDEELGIYCLALVKKYYQWQQQINERLAALQLWIDQLQFPYGTLHPSQRDMAESVYKQLQRVESYWQKRQRALAKHWPGFSLP